MSNSTTPKLEGVVRLGPGKRHRILSGHPWVYKTEIAAIDGEPGEGASVVIRDARGKSLGSGFYSTTSQIAVRRYSRMVESFDAQLLNQRLTAAIGRRASAHGAAPQAQRLVWSEADGLPGLIIDRYGDVIVLQALSQAMARHQVWIAPLVEKATGARVGIARNDTPVRQLEGLPLEKTVLWNHSSEAAETPVRVQVCGLSFDVDIWQGQKTGFYLDQVENYQAIARHAKARHVLDCFCGQGSFALAALAAGAVSAVGIDQSEGALARARVNAAANGFAEKSQWQCANAFDALRQLEREGQQFDLIILDPPSFTKTKAQVDSALRGYHELHIRALRLLTAGGLLATFSCSHHIGTKQWETLLADAAADSGAPLRLVQRLGQSVDHPILIGVPETEYLQGYLLEKI